MFAAATFVVVLLALAGSAPGVRAGPDVTGRWDIEFTGIGPGHCTAIVEQDAADLTVAADCNLIGGLAFAGTIDVASGQAHLEEMSFSIQAALTFAPSGDSLTGSWSAFGLGGTVSGTRTSTDTSPLDISGAWTFVFEGRDPPDRVCEATITQIGNEIEAVVTCGGQSTHWAGISATLTGAFFLEAAGLGDVGAISAQPSASHPEAMTGSWSTAEGSGAFFAFPASASQNGILSIDCLNAQGQRDICWLDPGDTMVVMVELVLPPTQGYDGFRISVRADGDVPYVPAAEAVHETPGCNAPQRTITQAGELTAVLFSCAPGALVPNADRLVEITFTCPPGFGRDTHLSLGFDTFFTSGPSDFRPMLAGAGSLRCNAVGTPAEALAAADVNCDGRLDSIDASLTLQYGAGLLESLPCEANGDITLDGETNSIDASVILQIVAGLLVP